MQSEEERRKIVNELFSMTDCRHDINDPVVALVMLMRQDQKRIADELHSLRAAVERGNEVKKQHIGQQKKELMAYVQTLLKKDPAPVTTRSRPAWLVMILISIFSACLGAAFISQYFPFGQTFDHIQIGKRFTELDTVTKQKILKVLGEGKQ